MQGWLYENDDINGVRYMLGTVGNNTLVCFGINPSTAKPDKLDPTLNSVQRIARHNGFDSWVMFNVYPKRDTIFHNLHDLCNDAFHNENIRVIKQYFDSQEKITVWAAWGDHIYERDYLAPCFKEIYKTINCDKVSWLATGKNKSGSPKHPLYQKRTAELSAFNITSYVVTMPKDDCKSAGWR